MVGAEDILCEEVAFFVVLIIQTVFVMASTGGHVLDVRNILGVSIATSIRGA